MSVCPHCGVAIRDRGRRHTCVVVDIGNLSRPLHLKRNRDARRCEDEQQPENEEPSSRRRRRLAAAAAAAAAAPAAAAAAAPAAAAPAAAAAAIQATPVAATPAEDAAAIEATPGAAAPAEDAAAIEATPVAAAPAEATPVAAAAAAAATAAAAAAVCDQRSRRAWCTVCNRNLPPRRAASELFGPLNWRLMAALITARVSMRKAEPIIRFVRRHMRPDLVSTGRTRAARERCLTLRRLSTAWRWITKELHHNGLQFTTETITVPFKGYRKRGSDGEPDRVIPPRDIAYQVVVRDLYQVARFMFADPTTHKYTSRQPTTRRDGLITSGLTAAYAQCVVGALPSDAAVFIIDLGYDGTHLDASGHATETPVFAFNAHLPPHVCGRLRNVRLVGKMAKPRFASREEELSAAATVHRREAHRRFLRLLLQRNRHLVRWMCYGETLQNGAGEHVHVYLRIRGFRVDMPEAKLTAHVRWCWGCLCPGSEYGDLDAEQSAEPRYVADDKDCHDELVRARRAVHAAAQAHRRGRGRAWAQQARAQARAQLSAAKAAMRKRLLHEGDLPYWHLPGLVEDSEPVITFSELHTIRLGVLLSTLERCVCTPYPSLPPPHLCATGTVLHLTP